MEIQTNSFNQESPFRQKQQLIQLELQENTLEHEKFKFLRTTCEFIESIDFEERRKVGKPQMPIKDILKSVLIMSYNSMSYRRAHSDLIELYNKKLISRIPRRSTLNKYMCLEKIRKIIERLIQVSALVFIDNEDTLICDSTWLSHSQYGGGYIVVHNKENAPLDKCTKMHVVCLKNSKAIAFVKATKGTVHDCPIFKELIMSVVRNGFNIRNILADSGYLSKDNYALCNNLNIENTFIDFKSNSKLQEKGRSLWAKQLKMFLKDNDLWHEKYRFRVVIEGIFSAIKKKQTTYLRSRKEISRQNELLLKALVYNLCIIGRYF
jgi:hypothetical protein